jgi:molecular chaperone DnaK
MRRVGIDLGTSTTVLAAGAEALHLGAEGRVLPSAVAFPPSGHTLVGAPARRRRALDPRNTILAAKRLIGRRLTSWETAKFREQHPSLELVEAEGGAVGFKTRAGVFTPDEIGALIVSAACRRAGIDPRQIEATVAVPAHFREEHRAATEAAIRRTGVDSITVVDEPTAVALAYSQLERSSGLAAVYDLGGGTFDFALVDCSGSDYRVLATDGDLFLGGDDIDLALATWARDELLKAEGLDLGADPTTFDSLIIECERAKIRMTYAERTSIDLAQVDPLAPPHLSPVIDREVLASVTGRLLQRTFQICDEVLRNAGTRADELNGVFMSGGSSLLPMVWAGLKEYFGKAPRCDFAPIEVVAIGASVAADR